jgi:TRAP-type C4-dicarboxylate transport system substrate-binding protein
MNKKKWESIPPDMQKIIAKVNSEWVERVGKTGDAIDASGKAFSQKQGGKVVTLSKEEGDRWVKAVQPVLNDYVTMAKSKGLPGDEVLKFALDYLKANQK